MTIVDFLETVQRHQQDRRRAAKSNPVSAAESVVVQYQSHPNVPYTAVTIYGPTEQDVQTEINRAMRAVEREGGSATFKGPRRIPSGGFGAIGEVTCA